MNSELIGLKALVNDVNKNVVESNSESESRDKEILKLLNTLKDAVTPPEDNVEHFLTGEVEKGTYVSLANYTKGQISLRDPSLPTIPMQTRSVNYVSKDEIERGVYIELPCKKFPKIITLTPSNLPVGTVFEENDNVIRSFEAAVNAAERATHENGEIYRCPEWLSAAVIFTDCEINAVDFWITGIAGRSPMSFRGFLVHLADNPSFRMDATYEEEPHAYYPQTGKISMYTGPIHREGSYIGFVVPALLAGVYDYTLYY